MARQAGIFEFISDEQFIINALRGQELSELELYLKYKQRFGKDVVAFVKRVLELEEKGIIERVRVWPINRLRLKRWC